MNEKFRRMFQINPDSKCWEWTGPLSNGYGSIWAEGKPWKAHRYSFHLTGKPIPKGMYVCHRCDNRKCVNPDHLFLGTQSDNMQDASKKNRLNPRSFKNVSAMWAKRPKMIGEDNPWRKLTRLQAVEIFFTKGEKQRDTAKRFGVGQKAVWDIKNGKTWLSAIAWAESKKEKI